MKKISDYLNDAKRITGSDYKTAQQLEVTRSAVSKWRRHETIGNEHAAKLAALLGVHPGEIIGASECETHPENRIYWERWVASVAILAVGVMALFFDNSTGYEVFSFAPIYIMCILGSVTCVLALLLIVSNIARRAGHNMDVQGYA